MGNRSFSHRRERPHHWPSQLDLAVYYFSFHSVFTERVRECESDNEGEVEVLMRKSVRDFSFYLFINFIYLLYEVVVKLAVDESSK